MPYLSKRIALRVLVLALTSALALAVVGAASAEFPTKRSDPSLRGTAQEGQTLNGLTGQWLDANGLPCTDCKMSYTWQRCNLDISGCADIPGATGFTYTLGAVDVGRRIRFVEWIFKHDCGALQQRRRSAGVPRHHEERRVGAYPTNVIEPRPMTTRQFTGTPDRAGNADGGRDPARDRRDVDGPGTITKTFFWQRCNTAGEGCFTIPGATGATYRLTVRRRGLANPRGRDRGERGGAAQAVSTMTAVVDELMPTASRPDACGVEGRLPHRLVLDRGGHEADGRQGDDPRSSSPTTRGFRVSGVQVRVTPTGLLAGSSAARATDRTAGPPSSTRRPERARPTCSPRPSQEGREAPEQACPREPLPGAGR